MNAPAIWPRPGRAGDCLAIEPLFLVKAVGSLELVGDVDQDLRLGQLGPSSAHRAIAGHHVIELVLLERRSRLFLVDGRVRSG